MAPAKASSTPGSLLEDLQKQTAGKTWQLLGAIWLWVKHRYHKWLARVSGNMDQNLRSISWWLNFDPYPSEYFERNVHGTGFLILRVVWPTEPRIWRGSKNQEASAKVHLGSSRKRAGNSLKHPTKAGVVGSPDGCQRMIPLQLLPHYPTGQDSPMQTPLAVFSRDVEANLQRTIPQNHNDPWRMSPPSGEF